MSNNALPRDPALTQTATTALSMLPAGARLADRYRILGVIGAGGMGIVYRAHDEQLDTTVALKILRPERRLGDEALERFRQEIRLARRVTHAAVVRIHDIGRDADIVFYTMDCVDGRTLREMLADGPLPRELAVKIARQLAEGLAAAHAEGVVHRDLKPENVLASEDGRAWLTDFGVARAIGAERVTRDGGVAGTPDYLSPEQIQGGEIDGRADIYALGLLLHEMLTGEVPLVGDTIDETAARRVSGVAADLRALKKSKGLQRIVARCLEQNPQHRYANAEEAANDLARGGARLRFRAAARWTALAAVLAIVIGVAVWLAPRFVPGDAAPAEPLRIAVLPLENLTGQDEYDWVRRGLSESLAGGLAENPGVQVVESLRVFQTMEALGFSESRLEPSAVRQLGALLDVSQLVSGGVVGDAQSLRLELTLRGLADGTERQLRIAVGGEGLLGAADEGVAQLQGLLELPTESLKEAPALSANVAAMTAYDEGIALLARGEGASAIEHFEKSTTADPQFGAGWNSLALAYAQAGRREEALAAAEKAVTLFAGYGGRAAMQARAQQAILAGDPEAGVSLLERLVERFPNDAGAQVQLAEQLGELGRMSEAQERLKAVVAADPNHPRAWFLLAKFAIVSGEARIAAEDYLVRALVIQNRLNSAHGKGETFNAMGIAHEQLGDLDVARQYYVNAIEMRTSAGDQRGVAGTLSNIARLDMIEGDFDAARAGLSRSLEILQAAGDTPGVADLRNEFGVLEEEAGDYAAARDHYREALRIRRQLGDNLNLAESYTNLAFTYLTLGEYDNAAVFAEDALETYAADDNARGRLTVLEIEGKLGIARADWDAALRAFITCLNLAKELDNPFSQAVAEGGLGRVAHYQGRPKAALEAWERALALLTPLEDLRGLAEYELMRADLYLALNAPAAAIERLNAISSWVPEAGSIDQRAEYQRLRGVVAAIEGRAKDAAASFDEARRLAENSGSAAMTLRVDLARLRWLEESLAPDPQDVADRAARLGDAPMRLEALELLAAARLSEGATDDARAALQTALRAPLRRDSWINNWRLNSLAARTAAKAAPEEASEAQARAAEQFASLVEATPEAHRRSLLAIAEAESLHVALP